MPDLLEVRFKGNRKAFFSWDSATPLNLGDPVVVEIDRGVDFGHVSAVGDTATRRGSLPGGASILSLSRQRQGPAASQTRTVASNFAQETTVAPSSDVATHETAPECSGDCSHDGHC